MAETDWQTRAAARKLRLYTVIALLAGIGGVTGFLVGYTEEEGGLMAAGNIPAWVAIVAVAGFLFAMTWGTRKYMAATDELDVRHNLVCSAIAGAIGMVLYPSWFVLWKGGLVIAPDAAIIFMASVIGGAAYYLYAKLTV